MSERVAPSESGVALTGYECGRVSAYSEWVALGEKPIAEVSRVRTHDPSPLVAQLSDIVERLGLPVRAFVGEVDPGVWAYGVFRHDYALEAWKKLTKEPHETDGLVGLVFGYSSSSVAGFTAALDAPVPSSPSGDDEGRVETFRLC